MENKLYCGAAKVDITPAEEELSGLFGLMNLPYAGIIDRLATRVAALSSGEEKALIVAFDLDKAPNPKTWLPELAAHTGIREESILYFGTHTHSAPLTTVRPKERHQAAPEQRANMERYEAVLHEKLFRCADEALANLRPARMGCAYGESFVNVNRNANFVYTDEDGGKFPFISEAMNWGAPVDRTLLAIRFEDLEGNPIAFFVNYAMHCCLMFQNNYDGKGSMGISGDIAGNVSRLLEEKYSGAVAVWSSGAAGDVDPVLFNVFIYPDPKDGHCVKEPVASWETSAQQLRMIVGWHYKDICETLDKIKCTQETAALASALEWSETDSYDGDPYRIRLQALRVGEAALLGIGGELYNSFGRRMREISPAKYTAVINHNVSLLDDAGYILDDDALARAAQDAPVPHMVPGGRSRSKPGCVGPSLERHTASLMEKVSKEGKESRFDWSCKHNIMICNKDGTLLPMDEPYYETELIAPGTWRILSSGDFSYLVAGDGEAMLIDSGYGAGNIRAFCEELCGLPVRWIANTHEHFDHTANNGYFDLAYMTAKAREGATIPFQSFAGIGFPRDYPVQIVKTGDVIPLPGRPLEVFELPDHSPGGAVYLDRKERILFSGDEIWEFKPMRGDPAAFVKYLETVAAHRDEFDVLWGGSGRHEGDVVDKLLSLCRRAAAGEKGEPAQPRANLTGPWQEILPDGTLVYDRVRPHWGDGGANKLQRPPTSTQIRTLTEGDVSIQFTLKA